jgi:serine/threonine-protein kinase
VLQAVDPTDVSRARWRDALGRRDGAALVKLAAELATQHVPTTVACSRASDLRSLKEWAAAERLLKAAHAHSPGDFWLNHGLAEAIYEQGPARAEEAVGYLRVALALRADVAALHANLGTVLQAAGKVDEAIACYRRALAIDPNLVAAHNNLGVLLLFAGQQDEAIACFRTAIAIDANCASAHHNLGNALHGKGQEDEAIACYRRAIAINPKDARAHRHLADALLPRVLTGEVQPAGAAERLALAQLCQLPSKSLYAAAVRFYADAFAEQPRLADDLETQPRYEAACAAALAGCGQGKDADQSDEGTRARLRHQALEWLRADLAAYRQLLEKEPDKAGPLVRKRMQHWHQDTDFAGARGEALVKLPEAERQAWQQLWAEVANTLGRAERTAVTAPMPDAK